VNKPASTEGCHNVSLFFDFCDTFSSHVAAGDMRRERVVKMAF
jgi:hypothetical protein